MARIVSTGATLSSPEFRNKKIKEKRRKRVLWSTGAAVFIIGLILVLRMERLSISAIQVEGAQVITEEEVGRNVKETLSGSYLWLIPKSNVAIYPRLTVSRNLEKQFPRFNSVSLSLTGPTELLVTVTEREPYALYCPTALQAPNASGCFFLDREGFIFDEAPDFSGSVYFIYSLLDPISDPKGKQFISPEEFASLSRFIERLTKLSFEPLSLERGAEETLLFIRGGARIVWKSKDNLEKLYSNIESFFESEAVEENPDFMVNLSLLDLRTENKVFYKFE